MISVLEAEAMVADSSECHRIERALHDSEERLRLLLDRMPIGCITTDLDLSITSFNPAAQRIFGYTLDELRTLPPLTEAVRASEWTDLRETLARLARGQLEADRISYNRTKEGRAIICEWHSTPLRDANGTMIGFLGMVLDITQRVNTEEALRQSEASLQDSIQEKDLLLKEMHHRVKNNMQVLSSLLSLQANSSNNEGVQALLADAQHRINSMSLVHEKLYQSKDLAKIDFGKYLRELVENLAAAHGDRARNVVLKVDAEHILVGLDAGIPCGLIVTELVSNALKHGFPDDASGAIDVRMARSGHCIDLSVHNTGRPLPAGIDFNQTNSLGMKLVLTLVRQLRGDISWDDANGPEFRIRLRLEPESQTQSSRMRNIGCETEA